MSWKSTQFAPDEKTPSPSSYPFSVSVIHSLPTYVVSSVNGRMNYAVKKRKKKSHTQIMVVTLTVQLELHRKSKSYFFYKKKLREKQKGNVGC